MRGTRRYAWLAVVLTMLAACAGEFTTQSEPLRLLAGRLPDAVINEPYSESIQAVGGLRPYSFALESGTLPPGTALEGGSVRGTPTAAGAYEFTVSVSDANLSSTFESFSLHVVTPPPPALTLQPPATETRGVVTLRGRVTDARSLVGLRTEITWDPEQFVFVEDSVASSRRDVTLFHEVAPGRLRVDVALLGGSLDGSANLFTFALTPITPPALIALATATEFASRRSGALLFDHRSATEGPGTLSGPTPPRDQPPDDEDDDSQPPSDEDTP